MATCYSAYTEELHVGDVALLTYDLLFVITIFCLLRGKGDDKELIGSEIHEQVDV